MTTVSHEPSGVAQRGEGSTAWYLVRDTWAAIAIVAMWVAVAVSAAWGADFVSTNGAGTNSTTIPSGIAVALFASVGTWAVAKYGFGRRGNDRD